MDNNAQFNPAVLTATDDGMVTLQQMGMLLAVCVQLTPYVLEQHRDDPQNRKDLDGGVAASVDTLLIHVCDRLEKIVGEDARWSYDAQAAKDKRDLFLTCVAANRQVLQIQALQAMESLRPSRQLNALPVHLSENLWVLCDGSLEEWRSCGVGIGNTPADACLDYDLRYVGKSDRPLDVLEQFFPVPNRKRK